MKPQRDERSEPTSEVERIVYDAACDLGWVIPQTEKDVEHAEQILGNTKVELPKRLRDPYALFDELCADDHDEPEHSPTIDRTFDCDEDLESRVFGSLIQMLRRKKRLSIETLAKKAKVEVSELISIETILDFEPKPRTVHQLATFFGLPNRTLLKLSNLTTVHDCKLHDAAVRFAAHSPNLAELSRDERKALAEFVKFLVSSEKSEGK